MYNKSGGYTQDFNIPNAIPTNTTGTSRTSPPANSRQPISVGRANRNRITAVILARPQVTLKARRIELINSQQNKINTNRLNILSLRILRILCYHRYLNADPLCILRIALLLLQEPNCQNSFSYSHRQLPPCAVIVSQPEVRIQVWISIIDVPISTTAGK